MFRKNDSVPLASAPDQRPRAGTLAVLAAVSGLAAAWIAAGDAGLLAHPLRHALTLVLLSGAGLLVWGRNATPQPPKPRPASPTGSRDLRRMGRPALVLIAAVLVVFMTRSSSVTINILAVSVWMAALAGRERTPVHALCGLVAETAAILGLFHFARTALPLVWLAADAWSCQVGTAVGQATGSPLRVGASFGGLDCLIAMLYLAVMAPLRFTAPGAGPAPETGPTLERGRSTGIARAAAAVRAFGSRPVLRGVLLVLAVHGLYLAMLSVLAPRAAEYLATPPPAATSAGGDLPRTAVLADMLLWNAPLLAVLMHAASAALILATSWGPGGAVPPGDNAAGVSPASEPGLIAGPAARSASRPAARSANGPAARSASRPAARSANRPAVGQVSGPRLLVAASRLATWRLALLLPLGLLLPLALVGAQRAPVLPTNSLAGRKIVFYEHGFLNWMRPSHGDYGRYSMGMYGMLPVFLDSLGADVRISPDLADGDLRDADAVVLIFPNQPWRDGQLERIWTFVRDGGSLLVLGEHTVREADGGNRFNDVLRPTNLRVRFDSATFAVGGWLQSYEPLWHPLTAAMPDTENDFGVVIGASLDVRPPAQPVLSGRWGWADPGDAQAGPGQMGNGRYDPGEKLGDLVLVAEQSLGRGKVVVIGDTSGLSNGINLGTHVFNARLFDYLTRSGGIALGGGWQLAGIAAVSLLVVLLAASRSALQAAGTALLLSLGLTLGTLWLPSADRLLPAESERWAMPLAYIDASHLEAYSRESWREDGVMGLCLTLIRNGYQPLMLPELTRERLSRARLLVCIAPARPYTEQESRVLRDFVRRGGTLIYTVGKDRGGPSRQFLADLDLRVGAADWNGSQPVPGWTPLGHFKTNYRELPDAYVRFHAAWPIACDVPARGEAARRETAPGETAPGETAPGGTARGDPAREDGGWERISYYPPDMPLILLRRLGRGRIVLVGDTCFAMNKNLELESGEPIEGRRENAEFWQWLLQRLRTEGLPADVAGSRGPSSLEG